MKNTKWKLEEIQILKEKYSNSTHKELLILLPDRTKMGIKLKAQQFKLVRDSKFRSGEHRKTKYNRNRKFFSEPNLLNCYWAGFIAADGGIDSPHNRLYIKLANLDHNHLEQFAKDVEFNGPIKTFWEQTDKSYSQFSKIVIDSVKQWVIDLDKHFNIHQNKTNDLTGPNLDPNSDLALTYIAGYIDGDGSIIVWNAERNSNMYKNLSLQFTGTKNILNWINNVIISHYPIKTNRFNNLENLTNTTVVSNLKISGLRAQELTTKIKTFNLPLLNRKWQKLDNLILGPLQRKRAPNKR